MAPYSMVSYLLINWKSTFCFISNRNFSSCFATANKKKYEFCKYLATQQGRLPIEVGDGARLQWRGEEVPRLDSALLGAGSTRRFHLVNTLCYGGADDRIMF